MKEAILYINFSKRSIETVKPSVITLVDFEDKIDFQNPFKLDLIRKG